MIPEISESNKAAKKIIEMVSGAGIDGKWKMSYKPRGKYIRLCNAYYRINDAGYYDGIFPFTVLINKNDVKDWKIVFNGLSRNRQRIAQEERLKDYLEDTIGYYIDF